MADVRFIPAEDGSGRMIPEVGIATMPQPATKELSDADVFGAAPAAPKELSDADVFGAPQNPLIQGTERVLGRTARDAIEGLTSLPMMVGNAANTAINLGTSGINKAAGTNIPQLGMPSQALDDTLTNIGLAKPQGVAENIFDAMAKGVASIPTFGSSAALSGVKELQPLLANYMGQATGAMGAGAGAEGAKQAGLPWWAQIGAGLAGGVLGGAGGSLGLVDDPAAMNRVPFSQARDAGYKINPAEVEPTSIGAKLAGESGKIKTAQLASSKNQQITNDLAAQELGLPIGTHLDEATFNSVRSNAAKSYKDLEDSASSLPNGRVVADDNFLNDVSGLDSKSADFVKDFPEAAAKRSEAVKEVQNSILKDSFSPKSGIEMIRNLRDDARVNLKNWADADKIRLGNAQKNAADALEDLIDRNLSAAGNDRAISDYRAARMTIAKAHDIESATDAAGNVSARKIVVLAGKRPLTGGLKTIADVGGAFPKSMQNPTAFGGYHSTSALDFLSRIGAGLGAAYTGNPAVAGLALAPEARTAARSLALSDFMQNRMLNPKSIGFPNIPAVPAALSQGAVPALNGQIQMPNMAAWLDGLFPRSPARAANPNTDTNKNQR